ARIKADPPSVALWDLHHPAPPPKFVFPGHTPLGEPFRADGKLVAVHTGTEVILYDTASGKEKRRLRDFRATHAVAFDPSGGRLAGVEWQRAVTVTDLTTGDRVETAGDGARAEAPTWSDDGRLLAVGLGRTVRVYEATPGRPPRLVSELTGHQNAGVVVRF